ncbi:hypothetical protein NDU88_001430 [Pleurodeles waltl]|uniref:Uncharacterized protein n=1 Tax=Pleurodeles waltl TaxID=8319 RepID=A0AAV7WIA9_PLEWA|nr:hypothetical protein NDU88_001430 [Pleurodeles waltl]
MQHQETVKKAGRIRRYNVAGSLQATLLQFCRRPGAVSGRSLAEVEERSAEESCWFLASRNLMRSPQERIGYLVRYASIRRGLWRHLLALATQMPPECPHTSENKMTEEEETGDAPVVAVDPEDSEDEEAEDEDVDNRTSEKRQYFQ